MDESHKDLLRRNLVALTTDLDPQDVYILLIQKDVLTEDEKEKLSNRRVNTCRRDEAHELIKVLQRKGPTAFKAFMDALQFTYPHLYGRISGGRTDIIPQNVVERVPNNPIIHSPTDHIDVHITIITRVEYVDRPGLMAQLYNDFLVWSRRAAQAVLEDFGCRILGIRVGSVVFCVECPSVEALDDLWKLCQSGKLARIFQNAFVTDSFLQQHKVKSVSLRTAIHPSKYSTYRRVLLSKEDTETKLLQSSSLKEHPEVMDESQREYIYDMESCKYRGHALVINNHQFETDDLKNREGWEADSENLQKLFIFLRFEQLELCNLNAKEMKEAIANFARDEKSLNASSLAVVIMTRGDENSFFGVDGCKIHPYDDVLLNFHRDNAPDLIEKPKLFIFQTYRGNREDRVQQVFVPQYESEALVAGATGGQPVQRKSVPLPNMLIVNATIPGYLAYRQTTDGSWLISDFCRIVRSRAREERVADIITEVSRVLNDREFEAIQQIHPENLLSRKWFLFPRERSPHEQRTPSEDSVEFEMEDRHKECLVKKF